MTIKSAIFLNIQLYLNKLMTQKSKEVKSSRALIPYRYRVNDILLNFGLNPPKIIYRLNNNYCITFAVWSRSNFLKSKSILLIKIKMETFFASLRIKLISIFTKGLFSLEIFVDTKGYAQTTLAPLAFLRIYNSKRLLISMYTF